MINQQTANWIWTSDWTEKDQQIPRMVLFRKTFRIIGQVESALINVSADSRYKLYVNENFVQVGPLKGTSEKWYYDQIDISRYLQPGTNVIAVAVLRYPPMPLAGNYSVVRTAMPGLYLNGMIKTATNTVPLTTDQSWHSFTHRRFEIVSEANNFAPMQIYEKSSGEPLLKYWLDATTDIGAWQSVIEYRDDQVPVPLRAQRLVKRSVPFMTRTLERFTGIKRLIQTQVPANYWNQLLTDDQPIKIGAHRHEVVEITANSEQTGYLRLDLIGGAGSRIKVLQSEAYVQSQTEVVNGLTIHRKDDREDAINGYLDGFFDTYAVSGYGTPEHPEKYRPFWFRTFRFIRLEITTDDQPLSLSRFDYESTLYPLVVQTHVETSDTSLADIWQLSERTLRHCMHETYEDCPYYEQQQYLMDTRAQILYTYAVSADDRLARKALDDFKNSQNSDGTLNASSPNYEENVIPTFSVYYIWMVYDHMMYFDNHRLIKDQLPTIQRILNYFETHRTVTGILDNLGGLNGMTRYWSFIDWTPQWNQTTGVPTAVKSGPVTLESLLYLYGLQAAIKLTRHLGLNDLAKQYEQRAQSLKQAIQHNCIGKNGMIQDGPQLEQYSQHAQVFGILTGVLSLKQGKTNLLRTINDRETYAQCSVAMSFYLFMALKAVGIYAESNQYWDIWRRMLAKHCTTSVEAEAGERSECHAWGALALYELPTTILGVMPASPGYRTIRIAPTPGYLTWAKGTVITPVGEVQVDWHLDNRRLVLNYQSPAGIRVEGSV